MDDKFFTIDEVTKFFKIPKSTIYKLSQQGKIPSSKIGKQLRFRKSSLEQWFSEKEGRLIRRPEKSVLLIEDDELVLRSLTRFLNQHGYKLQVAVSGEEAVKKAKGKDFDLIITDIRMPGIDGIETIKRIREINRQHNRPAPGEVVITGYADPEVEKEAKRLGIKDFIYKPFVTGDFLKVIEKKIQRSP